MMVTDSSEDEWEEVEAHISEDEVEIPENVEIELDVPDIVKKRQKKKDYQQKEIETCIRRAAKKYNAEAHIAAHKVHLLCLLVNGMRLNRICNNKELQCLALSLVPQQFTGTESSQINISTISLTKFLQLFVDKFKTTDGIENLLDYGQVRLPKLEHVLARTIEEKILTFKLDLVLIIIIALRAMGVPVRLVMSLQPLTYKVLTEKQKEKLSGIKNIPKKVGKANAEKTTAVKMSRKRGKNTKPQSEIVLPQVDGANDDIPQRVTRSKSQAMKTSITEVLQIDKLHKDKHKMPVVKTKKLTKKVVAGGERLKVPVIKLEDFELNSGKKTIPDEITPKKELKTIKKEQEISKDTNHIDETPIVKQAKIEVNLRKRSAKRLLSQEDEPVTSKYFTTIESPDSESDFEEEITVKKKRKSLETKQVKKETKKITTGVTKKESRTKSNAGTNRTNFFDEWLEVYSDQEKRWLCVDVFRGKVDCPSEMEKFATSPVHYLVGLDNEMAIKDVTARYASKWLTETRKLRVGAVDKDWWKTTLMPYGTVDKERDDKENRDLHELLLAQPIPGTICAFKNHPLFALRRHLLKYESIYPPDVKSVGFIRGEEIYPRSSIYTLHTRDKWLQEARTVKPGQEPYKMVASLWINMKLKQDMATLSMPLFGIWQTEPYVPPVAKDGKVPRNDYGNVDLFRPSMLPVGCVHLNLTGLQKVARKLNIDIATAITGFDSSGGYPYPVTEGYVVCEEHEEILLAAWREEQIHFEERERKKREQRLYGNWKLLIRGMQVKERIQRKYTSKIKQDDDGNPTVTEISSASSSAWQFERLKEVKKNAAGGRGRKRKNKDNNLFPFEQETL